MEKDAVSCRVGRNIRNVRKLRGLTLEALSDTMAGRTGREVSADAIAKYERGNRALSYGAIVDFAVALDCSIQTLIDGTDPRQEAHTERREMRMLSAQSSRVMGWIGSEWEGDSDALITAFGLYAATPDEYRRWAMLELLTQINQAIAAGAMTWEDVPGEIRAGIPHLETTLGQKLDEK